VQLVVVLASAVDRAIDPSPLELGDHVQDASQPPYNRRPSPCQGQNRCIRHPSTDGLA